MKFEYKVGGEKIKLFFSLVYTEFAQYKEIS